MTFFALQSLGCEVVTMHTSLDESTMVYILNLNKIEFLFTQADLIRNINKSKSNIQTANLINLWSPFIDQLTADEIEKTSFNIFDSEQLIAEGHALPEVSFNNNLQFSTKDIAVVMFTSGSTGQPKGVLLSHECMLENAKRYMQNIMVNYNMDNNDVFLGYLPSSHILEMLCDVSAPFFSFPFQL